MLVVDDDVRRYEVLPDRVNVYREKRAWDTDLRGQYAVIESDLIGHHVVLPDDDAATCHFFTWNGVEADRTSTGPFISRF